MTVESWSTALAASQVAGLVDHPRVLLVDIRPRRQYFREHILGSHSIPSGLLLASEVPDGELVLIGQDSQQAASVAEALHDQGYTRQIFYLEGGYPSCQQKCSQIANQTDIAWFRGMQQLIGAPVLLVAGAFTQSLALFGLGFVLLVGPWAIARSRA